MATLYFPVLTEFRSNPVVSFPTGSLRRIVLVTPSTTFPLDLQMPRMSQSMSLYHRLGGGRGGSAPNSYDW